MEHDLTALTALPGTPGAVTFRLRFASGEDVRAARVVLAMPSPALTALAERAPVLDRPDVRRLFTSVTPFPAFKLYYFDPEGADKGPAVLLAAYADGMDMSPWRALAGGASTFTAPPAMVEAAQRELRLLHGSEDIPEPLGSAYADWGADPRECGWHFWRPGARSREVLSRIVRPDPALALFLCGEAYSTSQALVEGALESAAAVVRALTG